MCEEAGLGGSVGSTTARWPFVNARLIPVTVTGTNVAFTTFTGTFVLPIVVVTATGMTGVTRKAGTRVFVDVTVGCGAPIPGRKLPSTVMGEPILG